ncbi:MAG: AAA family ATPase [candidate division WOR-3 bacterium]|nr:MAG: AAA family ATPase [candidate division WOR-3 bacterium]
MKTDTKTVAESERLRLLGGELRLLTIFFVNLTGIEKLIKKDTYATTKQHVQEFLSSIEEIVDEYNGTSNRIIPDFRILGIFGAPHAHHDDALRATRCASHIRDWWLKRKQEAKFFKDIDLRIGMNTGRAFFGFVLKESPFLTVIGDTINTAARITEISQHSEILMTRTTFNAVLRYIDAEHVGEQTVRGKQTKVDIYRLKKIRATPRVVEPQRMPLFGRESELNRLLDLAQNSREKTAICCLLNGQMGIGKTRLKEEFEVQLSKNDKITCFETNCSVDVQSPYHPFRTLLRNMLQLHELESQDITAKRLDEMFAQQGFKRSLVKGLKHLLLTDIGRLHSEEIRMVNEEIYASVRDVIRNECRKKPHALIFEEFGQADTMSKELLTYLINELENEPIMFLLINAPNQHFEDIAADFEEIDLKPLPKKHVHSLIRHILGDVDDALADFIYREAGGNPLFTIEAIRNTRRNRIIKQTSGKWHLSKEQALVFLDDLYGLVMSTIDSLAPDPRLIVDYASVIGYRFSLRILSELLTRPDLKEHLDYLIAEGYIVLSSDGEDPVYIFRHNLLKDAAYNVLPLRKRKEIHNKVASLLEQVYSDNLSSFYEEVARHYLASDRYGGATKYFKLAGDKAKNLYAIDQAHSFYEKVLDITKKFGTELPKTLYHEIMLNLIDIYEIKGDISKMERTAREKLIEMKDDEDLKSTMLFAERRAYALILLNKVEQAEELLNASIQKCDTQMTDILPILYADLGMLYANKYEYDLCLLNFNLSWRIARANDIKEAEIVCLLNLSKLHKNLGNYEKALDYLQHGLEILVDTEDIRKNIELQYLIANIDYEMWNIEKAKNLLSECLMTADSIGSFDAYIRSALDLARIYSLNGEPGHVTQYLKDVDKKISFLIRESLLAEINLKKALVYYNNGECKKANDYVINSLRIAERLSQREIEFQCYELLSMIDENNNMENAKKALKLAEQMKLPPLIASALYRMTMIFLDSDDIERARYYGRKALLVFDDIKSRLSDTNRQHFIRRPEYTKLLEI